MTESRIEFAVHFSDGDESICEDRAQALRGVTHWNTSTTAARTGVTAWAVERTVTVSDWTPVEEES